MVGSGWLSAAGGEEREDEERGIGDEEGKKKLENKKCFKPKSHVIIDASVFHILI